MNKKYEIKADELHIGEGIRIGNEVSISGGFDYTTGLNIPAKKVVIGDGVFLADSLKVYHSDFYGHKWKKYKKYDGSQCHHLINKTWKKS